MLAHAVQVLDLGHRPLEGRRQLLVRGRAAQRLRKGSALLHDLAEQSLDVHGKANRPRLIGEGPHHGLANPPRGIRRKAGAPVGAELARGVEQPDIALLDQVEQGQAAPQVPPCDADDEPQIGLDQLALGLGIAVLHPAGERLLLLAGEELDLGDVRQIEGQDLPGPLDRLRPLVRRAQLLGRLGHERLERLVRVRNLVVFVFDPIHGVRSSTLLTDVVVDLFVERLRRLERLRLGVAAARRTGCGRAPRARRGD